MFHTLSLSFILILCTAATARAEELPPPLSRTAECGVVLPCLPLPQLGCGLAANLRLGLA